MSAEASGGACPRCEVSVEGDWSTCPLCQSALTGRAITSPFPAVPLTFSRRRVFRVLFLMSLALVLASLLVQLFFERDDADLGAWRFVWLGVATMWLVVIMAIQKRHNLAKGTVYLVAIASLLCTYWDYLTGWNGWALTYVVPILCASAMIAVLITVRLMRMAVGDHILYSGLTAVMGLVPILFLTLNWVYQPLPAAICGVLSLITLILLQLARGGQVRHELSKRLHM